MRKFRSCGICKTKVYQRQSLAIEWLICPFYVKNKYSVSFRHVVSYTISTWSNISSSIVTTSVSMFSTSSVSSLLVLLQVLELSSLSLVLVADVAGCCNGMFTHPWHSHPGPQ